MAPCENLTAPTDKVNLVNGSVSLFGVDSGEESFGDLNCTFWNGTNNCSVAVTFDELPVKLNKFQIIKAVVLAGVTVVIMISICRMVFQLFVRYNVRHDR